VGVRVRVGALRQVVPETLEFCWRAVAPEIRLEVEPVAARARCAECGAEFAVDESWFECPSCHETGAEVLTGKELDLMSMELEEPEEAAR
jgi:hydrogenase nickel incorporation protein HypA/HybF